MVHTEKVEKTMSKTKCKDAKRESCFDGSSSKGSLDIQYKPMFKKRFPHNVPTKNPNDRADRVSNPTSQ